VGPPSRPVVRPFDRDADLSSVIALVGEARARGDRGAILHPGGLQWWLRRVGRRGFDVAVLEDRGAAVGLALLDEGDVVLQSDPAHERDRDALVAWVEARAREIAQREVFVSLTPHDHALRRLLERDGYEASDRLGYELVRPLADGVPVPDLPDGFRMVSLTPALADDHVQLHRAAWSRPDSPSTYDRAQHDLVTAMPDFRYDLVPIVAAPDGALAAYCISWWDPRSRSVEIEPLGTHAGYRRLGLARAVVHEVVRRSAALGAEYVLVWGASANPEARALYLSAGLRPRRVIRDYRLALS
jgi:ribosomal protein S18 acetylase RimI-like enzyme